MGAIGVVPSTSENEVPIDVPNRVVRESEDSIFSTPEADIGMETWMLFDNYFNDSGRLRWVSDNEIHENYYMGNQISAKTRADLISRGQADIVINRIRPNVRQQTSFLTNRYPAYNVTAADKEDRELASIFKELIYHIQRVNNWQQLSARSISGMLKAGLGCIHIYYDPNADDGEGEIKYVVPNYKRIAIDPEAQRLDFQDAANIFYTTVKPLSVAKEMFPKKAEAIEEMRNAGVLKYEESTTGEYSPDKTDKQGPAEIGVNFDKELKEGKIRFIERYTRKKVKVWFLIDPLTGMRIEFYDEEKFEAEKKKLKEKLDGDFFEGEVQELDRIVKIVNANTLQVERTVLPTSLYPFAFYVGEDTENPFPKSEVWFGIGPQDALNKFYRIMLLHGALAASPKLLISGKGQASLDIKKFRDEWNQPGSVNLIPEEVGITVENGGSMPTTFPQLADRITREMDLQFGTSGFQQGDPVDAPRTYKATMAIREWGLSKQKLQLQSIEIGHTILGKVTIQFIQRYYTGHKVLRIVRDANAPKDIKDNTVEINKPNIEVNEDGKLITSVTRDVTIGKYDLAVVSNSYLPTYAMEKVELFMDLMEKGIVDAQAVLENLDIDDVEEVLQRMSQTQIMADELESAAQNMKKLQGDVESRESALFQADRRNKELEVALALEKQTGKTQAQVARMMQAARSEIKVALDSLKDERKETQRLNQEILKALNSNNGQKQTTEARK